MKSILFSMGLLILALGAFAQKTKSLKEIIALVNGAKQKNKYSLADSIAQDYINNYLFRLKKDDLMTKDNLLFICQNISSTTSKDFIFLYKNRSQINLILDMDLADYGIRNSISKQFIPKENEWENIKPDWDYLEKVITNKFGSLGQEMVIGKKMIYYLNMKEWDNFGRYYVKYFKRALKRPEYNVNSITWSLFEHVDNPQVLKFACEIVMKYAMEAWYQDDPEAHDTYANLLYKTGKKDEAIKWEEKAVEMKKGRPDEKVYIETLEKMKRNEKTWPETAAKP